MITIFWIGGLKKELHDILRLLTLVLKTCKMSGRISPPRIICGMRLRAFSLTPFCYGLRLHQTRPSERFGLEQQCDYDRVVISIADHLGNLQTHRVRVLRLLFAMGIPLARDESNMTRYVPNVRVDVRTVPMWLATVQAIGVSRVIAYTALKTT